MENFDNSKLLPDGKTVRVPKLDDGLELQVALDELAAGSTKALHEYLAKQAGVDPATVSLRSQPWQLRKEHEDNEYSFIGALDSNLSGEERHADVKAAKPGGLISFTAGKNDETYDYTSLEDPTQQIRLLRLGKAERSSSDTNYYDHLKVDTFDLSTAPEYFCLSYVWGSPERFISIKCNGKAIQITQNLFHALKNIFIRYPDCYLWADGVCINQDDIEERACQVRLMGRIYSSCKMVIAHPGHFRYAVVDEARDSQSDSSSSPDLRSLDINDTSKDSPSSVKNDVHNPDHAELNKGVTERRAVGRDQETYRKSSRDREAVSLMNFIQRAWEKQDDYEIYSDSQWEQYSLPSVDGEDAEIWQDLFEFWEQDWLWRAWVLPECVLPETVIILFSDEYVVSLDALMKFWDTAHKRGLPAALRHGTIAHLFQRIMHLTPVTAILALRRQRMKIEDDNMSSFTTDNTDANDSGEEPVSDVKQEVTRPVRRETSDLLQVLILCRSNKATDNRDKVYALLGLANDSISQSIRPNYHDDNTLAKTFVDVAQRYISVGRGTEILENAGIGHSITGLPSWVPDWTQQTRSRFNSQLYNSSCHNLADSIRVTDTELNRLSLKGVSISKAKMCGPAWRFYTDDVQEPTFYPIKTRTGELMDIPPFQDEDARCFLLSFATSMLGEPNPLTAELYSDGLEQAMVRTLCADCSWSGHRLSSSEVVSQKFMSSYQAFTKFYARGPDPGPEQPHLRPGFPIRVHISGIFHWLLDFSEEEGEKLMQELWPFAMAMQEAMKGRRLASLESGHLAVLPCHAQAGDELVMVKGSRLPFLFREVVNPDSQESERTFELVGDCYVHGIMDGEILVKVPGEKGQAADESDGEHSDLKVLLPGTQSVADWEEFIIV